jgi:hypothetical protein
MIYDEHSGYKELLGGIDVDRTDDQAEGVLVFDFLCLGLYLVIFK